jgi:hypothetical protein
LASVSVATISDGATPHQDTPLLLGEASKAEMMQKQANKTQARQCRQ